MANSEQVVENDAGSSLIEELGRALHELEACKDSSEEKVQWMEIEEHFRNLETVLKKKSEELEAREKEYEEKEAETRALLAEREVAVVTKELELLDRIQELKDTAVSVIAEARANHQPSSLECIDGGDNIDRKTYLKDLRRNSQNTQRKGGNSGGGAGVQVDGNALELAALKVVIRCVEEYKLEADYPLDPLQKRLAQLEKSKSDKKRAGDFGKHYQSKKPKVNRGYRGLRGAATGPAGGWRAPPPWTAYPGMRPERYPHAVPNPFEYQIPSQSAYGQQANDQKIYYNPQDDRVTAASSYSAAPPNYGSYMGAGTRSSHQPYMQ